MQPMSSMQTSLLPGVTPGWNDPPPLGNPPSGSRLNRYRRVVDPSLSAAGGSPSPYSASSQQGMPMAAPHGMPPLSMQPMQPMQPLHQGHQLQPLQPMQPVQPLQQMHAMREGFALQQEQPLQHAPPMMQQEYAQPDYSMPRGNGGLPPKYPVPPQQQQYPGGDTPMQQTRLPPPLTTPASMSPYEDALPQTGQVITITHHSQYDSGEYLTRHVREAEQQRQQQQAALEQQQMANYYSNQPSTHSTPVRNSRHGMVDEANYVFLPLNAVPTEEEYLAKMDHFYNPSNFVVPTKAPGDVSLPPLALHNFLVKAAVLSLHESKSQGVQVSLRGLPLELKDLTKDDPFIKKFNYVVDAIDTGKYMDAMDHLEGLVGSYPMQTRLNEGSGHEKKWVGGIRLLLKELRDRRVH